MADGGSGTRVTNIVAYKDTQTSATLGLDITRRVGGAPCPLHQEGEQVLQGSVVITITAHHFTSELGKWRLKEAN